jgi:hypothetical protein
MKFSAIKNVAGYELATIGGITVALVVVMAGASLLFPARPDPHGARWFYGQACPHAATVLNEPIPRWQGESTFLESCLAEIQQAEAGR